MEKLTSRQRKGVKDSLNMWKLKSKDNSLRLKLGALHCPLCIKYGKSDCKSCPVKLKTGAMGCDKTPYPRVAVIQDKINKGRAYTYESGTNEATHKNIIGLIYKRKKESKKVVEFLEEILISDDMSR